MRHSQLTLSLTKESFDENEMIRKHHRDNNLVHKLGNLENLTAYQDMVEFKIPLDELYDIQAAALHTEGTNYCAIIIHIKNEKIIKFNNNKQYLL